MSHGLRRTVFVLVLVLLLGGAFLALLPAGSAAQGGTGIVRVAPSGTDSDGCGSAAAPCQTIQHAVHEATEGDELRIAAGAYTGAEQVYAMGAGQMTTMTQVVIVTKTLTLRGGYTTGDWDTPDPEANPTVVDAEGFGRGLTIVGDGAQTVTVEGLTITGGNYDGLGNPFAAGQCVMTNGDCGGGLYAHGVAIIVRSAVISGNVGSQSSQSSMGGGAYLRDTLAGSRFEDTVFANNVSDGPSSNGGGLAVWGSYELEVTKCKFVGNYASDMGGGADIRVDGGSTLIEDSSFLENSVATSANGRGGGLYIRGGNAVVRRSSFISNTGKTGGAFLSQPSIGFQITLDRNVFFGNSASQRGGGVNIGHRSVATLTNNVIAQNSCAAGAGLLIEESTSCVAIHNTIADNSYAGSPSEGIRVQNEGTTAAFTNNIIAGHSRGIRTNGPVTVTADHTFFAANEQDIYQPGGVVVSTNEITAHVAGFVDAAGLDYHLTCGSLAIDAGTDAGIAEDMDGDARPLEGGFDIGADETTTIGVCRSIFLPLTLR
jgi:hypothetical protein